MAKHKSKKSKKLHKKSKQRCDLPSSHKKGGPAHGYCMTCSHQAKKGGGRIKHLVKREFAGKGISFKKCSNGVNMKKGQCSVCGGRMSVVFK